MQHKGRFVGWRFMQIVMPWSSYYTGCHQYIESGVVVVVVVVVMMLCGVKNAT